MEWQVICTMFKPPRASPHQQTSNMRGRAFHLGGERRRYSGEGMLRIYARQASPVRTW